VDEPAPPLPGTGEINEDPQFVDSDSGDYSLTETSPCIDAGNPDPQFNDPDGTPCDMGALYYPQELASVFLEDGDATPATWGAMKRRFR
jgi:hypothetical protein